MGDTTLDFGGNTDGLPTYGQQPQQSTYSNMGFYADPNQQQNVNQNQYGQPQYEQPQYGQPQYGQPQSAAYGGYGGPGLPQGGSPAPQSQGGFAPNILGNLDQNMATQIGMAYGTQAFNVGQQYLNSNIKRYIDIPMLRYYFDVNNSYVANKLKLVLFPFMKKDWERQMARNPQNGAHQGFLTPRDDINAPDLYIPSMAFITFVLLVGFESGRKHAFTPEILGLTASTGLGMTLFELIFIKLGCYLLTIPLETSLFDLVAYLGYKYVGMIVSSIASLFFGRYGYWIAFLYSSVALMFFILRTLRPNFGTANPTEIIPQKRRRNYFLLAIAGLQVVAAWLLSR